MLINVNIIRTAVNRPCSNLVRRSSVSEDGPLVPEGITASSQPNEESAITATLSWDRGIFASLTMYDELSAARIPEEFGLVRTRLQQEWTFNRSFVSQFTIMFLNSQLINYSI